jgi:hypothetical protein
MPRSKLARLPQRCAFQTRPDDPHQAETHGTEGPPSSFDWRGWIALAWVVWFGLGYGKMVVEQRWDKLSSLVALLARSK